jgi:hypothetical protein
MDASENKYRFNWNAPIVWSQHEPNTYYHGAQVLLKTTDLGVTWTEISPDLTRNEKSKQGKGGIPFTNEAVGAENYGTLAYVTVSPHENVIWTGSDDGLVYVSLDGGKNWRNVTPNGLQECLINAIEVSPHDKATAYIATTRYKFNDHAPAIYKTTDYGKTWTKIVNGIAPNAFTRVVREDNVRKDLLFAGTEIGLYVSWNGGKNWLPFQLNLPITPITDLRVHQGDLIAATSGRSFWVLDDMELFRSYKTDTANVVIYQPDQAYLANGGSNLNSTDEEFSGMGGSEGVNPANGVVIYYHLTGKEKEDIKLTISDASGKVVRTFSSIKADFSPWAGGPNPDPSLSKNKGLNRFVWNMRCGSMKGIPATYLEASFSGHKVPPGTYTLALHVEGKTTTTTADILPNPLYGISQETYAEYHRFMTEMEDNLNGMHQSINTLFAQQTQLSDLLPTLPDEQKALKTEGDTLVQRMKAWDELVAQRKATAYDDVENFPSRFTANYLFLINQTESDLPRVNKPSRDRRAELDAQWSTLKTSYDALQSQVNAFNKKLFDAGIGPVWKKE